MKKVAIFVEGVSELIFTRNLLLQIFAYENLSIKCLSLIGDMERHEAYDFYDKPKIYFQIVNLGNDEKVLSFIKERFTNLTNRGFEVIIGLRDIYSAEYLKRSNNIDKELISLIVNSSQQIINSIQLRPRMILLFYAIMEFEAWLLSMPSILSRYNPILTIEKIKNEFGYDLSIVTPQSEFFHPANQIKEILNLINIRYDKSHDLMESILSHLEVDEIIEIKNNDKCPALSTYYDELASYV